MTSTSTLHTALSPTNSCMNPQRILTGPYIRVLLPVAPVGMTISCLSNAQPGHALYFSSRGSLFGFIHPILTATIESDGSDSNAIDSIDSGIYDWQRNACKHPFPQLTDAFVSRYLGKSDMKADIQPEPLCGCGRIPFDCIVAEGVIVDCQATDYCGQV